ncbi:hypothetical protein Tco_0446109 [Tanacetum coccineum]
MAEQQTINTAVAFDPFPSTDETETRPLREFLIKFLVLNRPRPLTLDFNTFCSSTGLDYNNGKYVAHPTPEVVRKDLGEIAINPSYLDKTLVLKNSFLVAWRILFTFVIQVLGGNYSSTEQVNSIQQLLTYCLITETEVDIGEIIYSDLVTKLLNKSRLKYVSYPRFISCALQVLLGSDYTRDKKIRFLPGLLSSSNFTKDPSKVTDIVLTAHMIAVNNQKVSVSLLPLAAKPKKGKSQTVTPTLPKLQGPEAFRPTKGFEQSHSVPSGTVPDPRDLERNIQLASMGFPSTLDEGTRGNIPPADMELIHATVANLSRTGAKYQVDETTFLLFDDELAKENDEEEVLAVGEDMDEDPQVAEEVRTPSPKKDHPESSNVQESTFDSFSLDLKKFDNILSITERQLIRYLRKMSRVLFSKITKQQWEQHAKAAVSYADLKTSIEEYYVENVAHRDQTDKLVETTMSTLDRSSTTIKDLYQGLNVITKLLQDINTAVTNDPATNKKNVEAIETFAKISTHTTEVLSLVKAFDPSTLQSAMKDLQAHALKQEEMLVS